LSFIVTGSTPVCVGVYQPNIFAPWCTFTWGNGRSLEW